MMRAPWDIRTTGSFAGDLLRMGVCFDPLSLSTVATVASIGGSIISGLGQMQAGKAAKVNADFQARQMRQQAGQERASAQRASIERQRKATLAMQRGQAVAAASGGGATDKTVADITVGIAKQGRYDALSELFSGEERARGLELGATSTQMQGKQAKKAGMIGGISTIVGGVGDTFSRKYGSAPDPAKYQGAEYAVSGLPWQAAGNTRPSWMY